MRLDALRMVAHSESPQSQPHSEPQPRQPQSSSAVPRKRSRSTVFPQLANTPAAGEREASPGAAVVTACGDNEHAPPGDAPAFWWQAEKGKLEAAEKRRNGDVYVPGKRCRGAIVADSRKGEGYALPSGTWKTCLPDATHNGLRAHGFESSLQKLRSEAVPQLGNDLQASWASTQHALASLKYPFKLVEATAQFMHEGGPMLNLLRAECSILIVGLRVCVEGKASEHCIMLSRLPEEHAPYGKLIDNHGKMKPVYIEAKDRRNKVEAARAFRALIEQNPAVHGREFTVEPSDVYELVPLAGSATAGLGGRVCATCRRVLPVTDFSKTQRRKGSRGCCRACTPNAAAGENDPGNSPKKPRKA